MPDVMLGTASVGTVGLIARQNRVSSTGWPGPRQYNGPSEPCVGYWASEIVSQSAGPDSSCWKCQCRSSRLGHAAPIGASGTADGLPSKLHCDWGSEPRGVAIQWSGGSGSSRQGRGPGPSPFKFQQCAFECDVTSRLENMRQQRLTNADNIRHECLSNSKTQFWI